MARLTISNKNFLIILINHFNFFSTYLYSKYAAVAGMAIVKISFNGSSIKFSKNVLFALKIKIKIMIKFLTLFIFETFV